MGIIQGNQYIPGPNDHHIVVEDGQARLEPGLGKDEPTEKVRAKAKAAGQAALEQMKATLQEEAESLATRETALEKRERQLAEREAALAEKEAASAKKAKPAS